MKRQWQIPESFLITLDHLSSDAENHYSFNIAKFFIYNLYIYNFVCIFIFLSCYWGVDYREITVVFISRLTKKERVEKTVPNMNYE